MKKLPTDKKLKQCGMDINEYLLRKNYVDAIDERDDLRNQVKVLSAIKRGLEKSLTEAFAKIAESDAVEQEKDWKRVWDYTAMAHTFNQFYNEMQSKYTITKK